MTDYSDYTERDDTPADARSDEEWAGVWNTRERNRDTMRKIELGLATVAAVTALALVRIGWLRMVKPPRRIIPSAADIHVRPPPPR